MTVGRSGGPAVGVAGAASAALGGAALQASNVAQQTKAKSLDSIPMLRADALTKTYDSGGRSLTVLKDITFTLEPGGFLAIVGPSGSGKTTLLGLLAGLDRPTSGTVHLDGHDQPRGRG